MSKVHVFNAGPCILPQQAIDNSIEALKDFKVFQCFQYHTVPKSGAK